MSEVVEPSQVTQVWLAACVHETRQRWRTILVLWLLVSGLLAVAIFLIPPTYRAEAVVAYIEPSSTFQSGALGRLSALGSLVAPQLFASASSEEAIQVLASKSLTQHFIETKGLLQILFRDDWDYSSKEWTNPEVAPSIWDGVRLFDEKIRKIDSEPGSNIIKVVIFWDDPTMAAEWANELVRMADSRLREQSVLDASGSIDYLKLQWSNSQEVSVREAIGVALEQQITQVATANTRSEFVLKLVDPAMPPDMDDMYRPQRLLLILLEAMASFLAIVFVFGFRRMFRNG